MNTSVTLTLMDEDRIADEFVFTDRTRCIVGRARDCDINVPADVLHQDVSRHHCEFEIEPPSIRLRDLGSLNGTRVNGVKVGRRDNPKSSDDETIGASQAIDLNPGDEVTLGQHTTLRVSVSPPPEYAILGFDRAHARN
jgi:pSer/pThr/pTyr-binding forkhead associated (FHA) protein